MIEILIIMFSGVFIGFIFRRKRSVIVAADKIAGWSIYLLLFLLGSSIGTNQMIIANFVKIGFHSILLALSGISGSLFFSFFVFKLFFWKSEA